MAEEFLEILQKIVKKDIFELTDYEKEFLRARRSYLSPKDKKKFAKVLTEEKEVVKE